MRYILLGLADIKAGAFGPVVVGVLAVTFVLSFADAHGKVTVVADYRLEGGVVNRRVPNRCGEGPELRQQGAVAASKDLPRSVDGGECSLDFTGDGFGRLEASALRNLEDNYILEAWIKPTKPKMQLVFLNGQTARAGAAIMIKGDRFLLLKGGVYMGVSEKKVRFSEWQHVALLQYKGRTHLLVDGRPVQNTQTPARAVNADCSLAIGGNPDIEAEQFRGLICAARILRFKPDSLDLAEDLLLDAEGRKHAAEFKPEDLELQAAPSPVSCWPGDAPYINTFLVAGPFDHGQVNAEPATLAPRPGESLGNETWRYFDDRLFSRNYDDYQDLRSYYWIKQDRSTDNKVVHLHVYIHSINTQAAQLRLNADNGFAAHLNGELVSQADQSKNVRDAYKTDVKLKTGWNRLLLQVYNKEAGRLGFYARFADRRGNALPGLTFSTGGPKGRLAVATSAMPEADTGSLPPAWREWSYVALNPLETIDRGAIPSLDMMAWACPFVLTAQGGQPPYRWSLHGGELPEGVMLKPDGAIVGTPALQAELTDYPVTMQVTDAAGGKARKRLLLTVKERPNKWFEEARLVGLIHRPEHIPADAFDEFASVMKRQGYQCAIPISYGNGEFNYRWISDRFKPNPVGDIMTPLKEAAETQGMRFGMYMGNLDAPYCYPPNGVVMLMEEAMRKFDPAVFWFDWAAWDGSYTTDSLFSCVKSMNPNALILINQVQTGRLGHGDWDLVCMEAWGGWADQIWSYWPYEIDYPKKHTVESWRFLVDPDFEYTRSLTSDWKEYLRVQLSLIGEGFVANIDHSPVIRGTNGSFDGRLDTLGESHVMQAHMQMADWASPNGMPPLYDAYTWVNPAPLPAAGWGYAMINLPRDVVYLHFMENARGKTGLPKTGTLDIGPFPAAVKAARWMNRDESIKFEQCNGTVTLDITSVTADEIDTIIKLELQNAWSGKPQAGCKRWKITSPDPQR